MKTIELIKPDVYDDFQCKGAACRRTCCAGWKITVSKSEYQDLKEKLKHMDSKTLRRLPEQGRSTQIYGEFILEGASGCGLQSQEGLCGLQLSLGAEALPDVCKNFPRRGVRCDEQMQLSLTPACEQVLELLLEKDGPLAFIRQREPLPQMLTARFSGENASIAWNRYLQLQEFCILLLQIRDVPLDARMALLGMGLYSIDACYKKKEPHKVSGCIDRYLAMLAQTEDAEELIPPRASNPALFMGNFFASAAISTGLDEIVSMVQEELKVSTRIDTASEKAIFSYSIKRYQCRKKAFNRFTEKHPFFLENVMVMLFTTRWCSVPYGPYSIWEEYLYACWVYSNLKLVLTACMEKFPSDEDLLDICVRLFRSWIHNERPKKKVIQHFHDTGNDTPAHMSMLLQAG